MNPIHVLTTMFKSVYGVVPVVLLILLTLCSQVEALALSQVNRIDLHETNGSLYLYVHTDAPLRHEAKKQSNQVVLDLYETHVLGNQLGIFYEKAPSIHGVSVKYLEDGHIQLRIEGHHLDMPIVGFRELGSSPIKTVASPLISPLASHRVKPIASKKAGTKSGDVFLAIESETAKQIPTEIKKTAPLSPNTELKAIPQELLPNTPKEANLPTAIASEVLEDESLSEEEAAPQGIRQASYELLLLLAQWAKNHLGLLLGLFIFSGISFFALFKFADTLRRQWMKAPMPSTPSSTMPPLAFREMESSISVSTRSRAVSPSRHETAKQHTLERVREKMKLAGFASVPTPPTESTEGVNLRVKEAIARKQAQRYTQETGKKSPFVTTPSSVITPNTTAESGNAFLHAMAQHMDVSGQERIAKALQQSKKYE